MRYFLKKNQLSIISNFFLSLFLSLFLFCWGYIIVCGEFIWTVQPHTLGLVRLSDPDRFGCDWPATNPRMRWRSNKTWIVCTMASQITSLTSVYSTVYSDADQRKHQSSASLAFVRGIHRGPVNSPHKWPVTLKIFPFDDVIIYSAFG